MQSTKYKAQSTNKSQLTTADNCLPLHHQSVVSKLNSIWQPRGIPLVLDVVRNVCKVSAARFQFLHVLQSLINPQMSRVLLEAQTVKHQYVEVTKCVHCLRWDLA